MVPLRAAALIDAPPDTVRAALVSAQAWGRAAAACGRRLLVADDPADDAATGLTAGVLVRTGRAGRPGLLFRVAAADGDEVSGFRMDGVGRATGRSIRLTAAPTPAGSLVTVDVRRTGRRPVWRRRRILNDAQVLLGVLCLVAREHAERSGVTADGAVSGPEQIAPAPADTVIASDHTVTALDGTVTASEHIVTSLQETERTVVVAGIAVRDGAVLAARRTYPADLAGYWECPGGKVDPGESEADALVRELHEELDVTVTVGDRIGPAIDLPGEFVLHAYRVALRTGEPRPIVHDAVRWVTAAEVGQLNWLPSDRPLIPFLQCLLTIGDSGELGGEFGGEPDGSPTTACATGGTHL